MGYQLVVVALRSRGEISVIGAFRYGSILWAIAIGYVVWGDVPNALALSRHRRDRGVRPLHPAPRAGAS